MKIEVISSLQNPKVKNLVKLIEKSSERRAQQLIVVEGLRELGLAISAGMQISQLYFCPTIGAQAEDLVADQYFEVTKEVFAKIAYRENSDGFIGLLVPRFYTLETLPLSDSPFIITLEAVEKPGNLGAILRTADAANIDAVIICDPKTDIYKFELKTGDTEGLVNYLLSIHGIKFAAIVIDREEERKWSFRSKGNFDVNIFARTHFEGGGHANAAGGSSKKSVDETFQDFKNILETYKSQLTQLN